MFSLRLVAENQLLEESIYRSKRAKRKEVLLRIEDHLHHYAAISEASIAVERNTGTSTSKLEGDSLK